MGADVDVKRCRVLRGIFGTVEYLPEQVAALSWVEVASIPGCGNRTVDEIRRWLAIYGFDLKNVPTFVDSNLAADTRLLHAMIKLHQRGFKLVLPINEE